MQRLFLQLELHWGGFISPGYPFPLYSFSWLSLILVIPSRCYPSSSLFIILFIHLPGYSSWLFLLLVIPHSGYLPSSLSLFLVISHPGYPSSWLFLLLVIPFLFIPSPGYPPILVIAPPGYPSSSLFFLLVIPHPGYPFPSLSFPLFIPLERTLPLQQLSTFRALKALQTPLEFPARLQFPSLQARLQFPSPTRAGRWG